MRRGVLGWRKIAVVGSAALASASAFALFAASSAPAHRTADASGGEPIAGEVTKREMIAARQRFFGPRFVDPRTGAVRRDRVILSWFGVTNFAMAIRGHVVLLDAWVPRGAHSGYVPTSPDELAALRPKLILIGYAHFDHAADAVPLALATGARLVGTAEHCAELRARAPATPPACVEAIPADAAPGTAERLRLLRGVRTRVVKHLHSAATAPDGEDDYHVPVAPLPSTTTLDYPRPLRT